MVLRRSSEESLVQPCGFGIGCAHGATTTPLLWISHSSGYFSEQHCRIGTNLYFLSGYVRYDITTCIYT